MRTNSNLVREVLSVFILLGAVMIATAPEAWAQALPFENIEKGGSSGFSYGGFNSNGASFVFTDHPSWERFWRMHKPGVPIPEVRFPQENVAAVIHGSRSTIGGPATEIVMVEQINQGYEDPCLGRQPGRTRSRVQQSVPYRQDPAREGVGIVCAAGGTPVESLCR